GLFQNLIPLHDLLYFFKAARTQGRDQHRFRSITLRFREVAHAQASAFDESCWQIRPALALGFIFEIANDFRALIAIEQCQEFVRRGGNLLACPRRRRVALGKTIMPKATEKEHEGPGRSGSVDHLLRPLVDPGTKQPDLLRRERFGWRPEAASPRTAGASR